MKSRKIIVRLLEGDEVPAVLRKWARTIYVTLKPDNDRLLIRGSGSPADDLRSVIEVHANGVARELVAVGPHLEFSNATSDKELINFIGKWGPICAPTIILRKDDSAEKRAVESLAEVWAVQRAVAAAVRMLSVACEYAEQPQKVIEALEALTEAVESARKRAGFAGEGGIGLSVELELITEEARAKLRSRKLSDTSLRESANDMLCAVLNRFHETLIATREHVLVGPAAGHGVLPFLMLLLRFDLLAGRTIVPCKRCGALFLKRRFGEERPDEACSLRCKNQIRSARYYECNADVILADRRKNRKKNRKKKTRKKPAI